MIAYVSTTTPSISSILSLIPIKYPAYAGIVFVFCLFIYRLVRAAAGEKFTDTRVFLTPVLYSMFVLVTFIYEPYVVILAGIIITVFGIILGLVLSKNVKIFSKNRRMYYSRSLTVTFFWTLAFTAKLLLIMYFPSYNTLNNQYVVILFDVLLTVTTGMLLGEALIIYHRHSKFVSETGLP